MRYLFAFSDTEGCLWLKRALKERGIACEIRTADKFPDGTQGPELWVRDEDYDSAYSLMVDLQSER